MNSDLYFFPHFHACEEKEEGNEEEGCEEKEQQEEEVILSESGAARRFFLSPRFRSPERFILLLHASAIDLDRRRSREFHGSMSPIRRYRAAPSRRVDRAHPPSLACEPERPPQPTPAELEAVRANRREMLAAILASLAAVSPAIYVGVQDVRGLLRDRALRAAAVEDAERAVEQKLRAIADALESHGQLHHADPESFVYHRPAKPGAAPGTERHLFIQLASIDTHAYETFRLALHRQGLRLPQVVSTGKRRLRAMNHWDGDTTYVANWEWVRDDLEQRDANPEGELTDGSTLHAILRNWPTAETNDPSLAGRVHVVHRVRGEEDPDFNNAFERMIDRPGHAVVDIHRFSAYQYSLLQRKREAPRIAAAE